MSTQKRFKQNIRQATPKYDANGWVSFVNFIKTYNIYILRIGIFK